MAAAHEAAYKDVTEAMRNQHQESCSEQAWSPEDDVVLLGEGVIEEQGKSVSLDSNKKRSSAGCGDDGGKRVLADDDHEIDENDDGQCSAAEKLDCSENGQRKKLHDEVIHVDDADDFDEGRDGESDDFDDKGEDFDNTQTHWNSTHEMGVEVEPRPCDQQNSDFIEPTIIESDGDGVESSGNACSRAQLAAKYPPEYRT